MSDQHNITSVREGSKPSKDDWSLRLSIDADPAVCNFWPALQCSCTASRNFALIFEALSAAYLPCSWFGLFPPLAWALGAAQPPLVPCATQHSAGVTQVCLHQYNYHNLLHSQNLCKQKCAQLHNFFWVWRKWGNVKFLRLLFMREVGRVFG